MLLEASSKGAVVDVDTIPGPRKVDRIQWLLAYQGCGFVVTCPQDSSAGVIRKFESAGLSAAECGHVNTGSKLTITGSGGAAVLFDFKTHTLGCRATQKI
jgi:selenophosphate synthetase-related protein